LDESSAMIILDDQCKPALRMETIREHCYDLPKKKKKKKKREREREEVIFDYDAVAMVKRSL
jgi:hypothetical protein